VTAGPVGVDIATWPRVGRSTRPGPRLSQGGGSARSKLLRRLRGNVASAELPTRAVW